MKLYDLKKVVQLVSGLKFGSFSYVPQRNIRYQESVKWVKPRKVGVYEPARSGDLSRMTEINPDMPYWKFRNSKELETANENVKKIFSIGYQLPKYSFESYKNTLIEKVRNNPYDEKSLEVRIARCTAEIRYLQEIIQKKPTKFGKLRIKLNMLIDKRKRYLKDLRSKDYKKFEWLLETLDLEYKPTPVPTAPVTRRKSLILLAKLKVEQLKEEKLGKLRKLFDEQKVTFLEKKIIKLREIKAKEEEYNLPASVTDADIQECIERLEKVKIEVAERSQKEYVKKIHPFYLEAYDKDLLWEKEKAGEKIREQIINQNLKTDENTN